MPIYEYVCEDCGTHFEVLRPMKDADAPIGCRRCESRQTERMLSVFYAQSGGRAVAGTSGSACGSCSGGSCASCGSH
jgi:putative FmdB family regulatory protein